MDSARTEAVARKVAEVLGDEVNPRGPWFIIVSPATHAEELLCLSAAEYLSDLNVAGRVLAHVQGLPTNVGRWGVRNDRHILSSNFKYTVFDDCPAAIDALLVAAGLLEPDKEGEA